MMAQRSSGPGSRNTKQHIRQHRDGHPASREDRVKTKFPPIDDNMVPTQPATQDSMTGKLGMFSSPRKPMMAFYSGDHFNEAGRSNAPRRTSHKDNSRKSPIHSQTHEGSSPKPPRSGKRSGSYNLMHVHSDPRRSSSSSSVPHSVPGPSNYKPLPREETSPCNGKSAAESSGSRVLWNGSVSTKKKSTHSVKDTDGCNSLAQSARNSFPGPRYQPSFNSSNGSQGRLVTQCDASTVTQTRAYDTVQSPCSHLHNANNNSSRGGSTALSVSAPHSSSNGRNLQSDLLLHQVSPLPGEGARHSKHKHYETNGTGSTHTTLEASHSSRGTGGSHMTASPPYRSPPPTSAHGSHAAAPSLSPPCSSSNRGHPQSDSFSPTSRQGEGLSGGGPRHSKHRHYKTNGTGSTHTTLETLHVAGSTGSSHMSSTPPYKASKSPSPPMSCAVSSRAGLRGLRNLGNTCFMNSILQCLSHTPGMAELFLNERGLRYCGKSMLRGELAKAYARLMSEMWSEGGGVAVSPHDFKSQIQKYARRFMGYEQQDCQEFLRFMLAGLHDDLNQPRQRPRSAKSFPNEQAEADYYWEKYLSHECSKISDLFMGQLRSTLVCLKCSHMSLTFDPFWDLSLPMPRLKGSMYGPIPLERCLNEFTAKERLTGSEQAYCERCDALCDSEKGFKLQRLPEILVLHLKRFSGVRFRSKLDTAVEVPLDLDLEHYCVNPSEPSAYCLYAMSNHSGTAYGGHYTALSRHVNSKRWYNFNDSQVSEARPPTPTNVHSTSQAYVLFYHRKK